ncbi:MAG TPA: glycosyltransferase [Stellaceae bacterium]|nr:glycosyltransferase [Stellaceae bacterium]
MKRVALFSAHFPPSNFASVHRPRLWAQYLHEFGWKPVVVTTHWRYYEETPDWELCELLDPALEIVRTPAFPTKPLRLVGDIGIRGLPWHLTALRRLIRKVKIDFLHITVPSFFSAILGELIFRNQPIAFGIDFQDPWVHEAPQARRRFTKAWTSLKMGETLEPWAVRHASLITGITEGYYSGVLERNPHLHAQTVTAAMPLGNSARDFEIIASRPRPPYLFDPNDGAFHMVYAGVLLPRAEGVLNRLFAALAHMKIESPDVFSRLRIHFVGTGRSSMDPKGYNILPRSVPFGLHSIVTEHPQRVSYVDVLSHLTQASAILILGSTERHYSPSKVYQSIQARRPVFALLHEASTALQVLDKSNAGVVVRLSETALPEPQELASKLASFVRNSEYIPERINWSSFEAFSARESARKLALALDAASERFKCHTDLCDSLS